MPTALTVCRFAQSSSVTGSSPPQTFSRWFFKNHFKAAWRVGPPQFWLGALAGTVAPHPSPKATSRAIFDDFHTGDRCRWSVQASQWPIPASGHCNNSPATGLSAVGLLLVQGCSQECSPPPLGKMRVPRMWRAAASAAAPHSQPCGAWLKQRPARGETDLGLLVGRPRPAPRRPYHVALL